MLIEELDHADVLGDGRGVSADAAPFVLVDHHRAVGTVLDQCVVERRCLLRRGRQVVGPGDEQVATAHAAMNQP
ncbi:hypothetical protein [Streptomyces sp. NPDC058385]|uniref:hypothetical protein n=1 Tax=Streptomyces sp. NPDC058385 TaxID=3346473 RepID=UPI00365EF4F2